MKPSENKDKHQHDINESANAKTIQVLRSETTRLRDRLNKTNAENRNLRMDVKLWKNRTTEAANVVEALQTENEQHQDFIESLQYDIEQLKQKP